MVKTTQTQPVYLKPSTSVEARVQDLIERMTLDEKLAQLSSYWFNELQVDQQLSDEVLKRLLGEGIGHISRVGGTSTQLPTEIARAGNHIQRFLVEQTRLGIPAILHEECCLGYLGLGATIFPQMIGLASTWNPDLAEQMTTEIRRQMLAVGTRQGLGPVLDIGVDPRWGRIEETFGEDPVLVSQFGMAYVRGLQGEDKQVVATGKHFVGHSSSIGGMNCGPVNLGPHALWETHLMPFQAAIQESGLGTIMNSYPELDGDVVASSRAVLTDLLRGKLGFDGPVVSDYLAIAMIHDYHRQAPDRASAAALALKAGIDVELPSREYYNEPLRAALESGKIALEDINLAVSRALELKFRLGLFENPYVDEGAAAVVFETQEQRSLAREIARQSIVLLKNDGLLPLEAPATLAVIGPNANTPRNMLGDYSYPAMFELVTYAPRPGSAFLEDADKDIVRRENVEVHSVLDGIRAHLGEQSKVLYAQGCSVSGQDRSGFDEAVQVAEQADVVILVLGDKSGLVPDCTTGETRDRAELGLPGVQQELVEAIAGTGKPIVAVLVNGRPCPIPWMEEHIPAILEAWLPGEEGGGAVADILFGAANPGGKLPVTVPYSAGQIPINYNHKPSGGRSNWYVDYVDMPAKPLYPFGHGLSYTSFSYSDLSLSAEAASAGEHLEISFKLSNDGKMAGDEVVQLYLRDEYGSRPRPVKELKGFCRVHLQAGESQRVVFQLPVDMLAFYDEALNLVVESGDFSIMLGSSSEDIRLEGRFRVEGSEKSPVSQRIFTCPVRLE